MGEQTSKELFRIPRNKGLLGQDTLFVKNGSWIWCLRNTDSKLIGKCSLDMGQTWMDSRVLTDDYSGYFSFTVTDENVLHMSFKNSSGYLVYCCWAGGEIKIEKLGEKWLNEERVTFQTILVSKQGTINLIYFSENILEGIWRIKHCTKSGDKWDFPQIVDYGLGPAINQGTAAIESNGTLHLVYQVSSSTKYTLVYRQKTPSSARWNEKEVVIDTTKSSLHPCMVVDESSSLHLVCIRSDGMNYRAVYRCKVKGGWLVGGWQKEKYLSMPGVNAYTPSIGILDNAIVALWQQVDGIYKCSSYDQGKTFTIPAIEEKCQKLAISNLISVDFYRKQGSNAVTSFDTGSTSVALLAAVFQSTEEPEEQEFINNLPDIKGRQDLIFPNMDYLGMKYVQKGLQDDLVKVNGNIQRLFFETEDVKLTNLQMRETIDESNEKIATLEQQLRDSELEINKLKEKNISLENLAISQKESFIKNGNDYRVKIEEAEGKIRTLQEENFHLHQSLESIKSANVDLRLKLKEVQQQKEALQGKLKALEDTVLPDTYEKKPSVQNKPETLFGKFIHRKKS